jgi:SAM-dependent methyltransferase
MNTQSAFDVKTILKHAVGKALTGHPQTREKVKKLNELIFWKLYYLKDKNESRNGHYVRCFTDVFGLTRDYYDGKKIIDVGCGPLGSLEWADNSMRRVGLDVLAKQYIAMNKGKQKMEYVTGGSEEIPFPDSYFDVVAVFNALDHVFDIEKSLKELHRVCKTDGDLLLICEIDHPPTITEPHTISENIVERIAGFRVVSRDVYQIGPNHNVFSGVLSKDARRVAGDPGVLCAHLRKLL